jgi:hypothetical protein
MAERRTPSARQGTQGRTKDQAQSRPSTEFASGAQKEDGAIRDGGGTGPHRGTKRCGRFPTVGKRDSAKDQDQDSGKGWKKDTQRENSPPLSTRARPSSGGTQIQRRTPPIPSIRSSDESFQKAQQTIQSQYRRGENTGRARKPDPRPRSAIVNSPSLEAPPVPQQVARSVHDTDCN